MRAQVTTMGKIGFYLFFSIFAFAGLICGAWGAYNVHSEYTIKNEGIQTTGSIIDLKYSNKGGNVSPVIGFRDQSGREVVYHSNFYTNMVSYQIGQPMTLWYLPEDPQNEVILEGGNFMTYFPFLFLFTHGGVGFGGLIWLEMSRRRVKWLKEYGQEVQARYVKTQQNSGKRTTYQVVSEWKDPYTQTVYEFKSERLSQNPEASFAPGQQVRVLIDPNNPKRYWMDF